MTVKAGPRACSQRSLPLRPASDLYRLAVGDLGDGDRDRRMARLDRLRVDHGRVPPQDQNRRTLHERNLCRRVRPLPCRSAGFDPLRLSEPVGSCGRTDLPERRTEVLLVGPSRPVIAKGLSTFTVHSLTDADREARLASSRPCARDGRLGDAAGRRRAHGPAAQPRHHRELRRRLRPCRRCRGRAPGHRRHQHARRAHRGGRRHRDRPALVHGPRVAAGRALSARRQMARARLSR